MFGVCGPRRFAEQSRKIHLGCFEYEFIFNCKLLSRFYNERGGHTNCSKKKCANITRVIKRSSKHEMD